MSRVTANAVGGSPAQRPDERSSSLQAMELGKQVTDVRKHLPLTGTDSNPEAMQRRLVSELKNSLVESISVISSKNEIDQAAERVSLDVNKMVSRELRLAESPPRDVLQVVADHENSVREEFFQLTENADRARELYNHSTSEVRDRVGDVAICLHIIQRGKEDSRKGCEEWARQYYKLMTNAGLHTKSDLVEWSPANRNDHEQAEVLYSAIAAATNAPAGADRSNTRKTGNFIQIHSIAREWRIRLAADCSDKAVAGDTEHAGTPVFVEPPPAQEPLTQLPAAVPDGGKKALVGPRNPTQRMPKTRPPTAPARSAKTMPQDINVNVNVTVGSGSGPNSNASVSRATATDPSGRTPEGSSERGRLAGFSNHVDRRRYFSNDPTSHIPPLAEHGKSEAKKYLDNLFSQGNVDRNGGNGATDSSNASPQEAAENLVPGHAPVVGGNTESQMSAPAPARVSLSYYLSNVPSATAVIPRGLVASRLAAFNKSVIVVPQEWEAQSDENRVKDDQKVALAAPQGQDGLLAAEELMRASLDHELNDVRQPKVFPLVEAVRKVSRKLGDMLTSIQESDAQINEDHSAAGQNEHGMSQKSEQRPELDSSRAWLLKETARIQAAMTGHYGRNPASAAFTDGVRRPRSLRWSQPVASPSASNQQPPQEHVFASPGSSLPQKLHVLASTGRPFQFAMNEESSTGANTESERMDNVVSQIRMGGQYMRTSNDDLLPALLVKSGGLADYVLRAYKRNVNYELCVHNSDRSVKIYLPDIEKTARTPSIRLDIYLQRSVLPDGNAVTHYQAYAPSILKGKSALEVARDGDSFYRSILACIDFKYKYNDGIWASEHMPSEVSNVKIGRLRDDLASYLENHWADWAHLIEVEIPHTENPSLM